MRISKIYNTSGWLLVAIIILVQAKAYLHILTLSLGPRVVLQPWLMRQGYLLYKNIADEHSPLMYLILSVAQPLATDSLQVAKLTLVTLTSTSTLLTFWAGQKSGGWLSGVFSALFFALWSPIFGYGKLWHETFLAPLYILILILWHTPTPSRPNIRLFFTGLLLGTALLVKQHALAVTLGIILWRSLISWHRCSKRQFFVEIALLLFGLFLPIGIFTIYYWLHAKTLKDLAFWLVTFNFINRYIQLASLWPSFEQIRLLAPAYLLLPPFLTNLLSWDRKKGTYGSKEELGLILLVTSSLTVYPRFGFFHLQSSLPILAWLSGTTLACLMTIRYEGISNNALFLRGIACSVLLLWTFHTGVGSLYNAIHNAAPQKIYEYSNLVPLANEIRQYIGSTDCIYVLPDDEATANLYYLTGCLPPKLWSPTSYPWFMIDAIKPKIVRALEESRPDWIVYFPGRWGIEQHGRKLIDYVRNNYHLEMKLSWAEGEVWLLKRSALETIDR